MFVRVCHFEKHVRVCIFEKHGCSRRLRRFNADMLVLMLVFQKSSKDDSPPAATHSSVVMAAALPLAASTVAASSSVSVRRLIPQRSSAAPSSPSQIVPAQSAPRVFTPSLRWEGARPGFVFSKGPQGLGYYPQDKSADTSPTSTVAPRVPETIAGTTSNGASSPAAVDQAQR
jgi:hypothetical protein